MMVTGHMRRFDRSEPRAFARLMQLYEKNFVLLHELVPGLKSAEGIRVSRIEHGLTLYLNILEQAPFTTILNLSYRFERSGEIVSEPDLTVRVYHDARMAEAMAWYRCDVRWIAGRRHGAPAPVYDRWRRNRFLYKWLSYCLHQGHLLLAQGAEGKIRVPEPV